MSEPIISVSGLRGIIGESLTPEIALRYACAFAAGLPEGQLVVTRDSRPSGRMIGQIVQAGLAAMGRTVIDGQIAATPTTGVLIRQLGAAGGIQVSASHNPSQYNGLKLFSGQGRVIGAAEGEQVLHRYEKRAIRWVGHERLGQCTPCEDAIGHHLELVLATVDADRIRSRGFRVLLDSNGGAGSIFGRRLLEALGCHATLLGGDPDGRFLHPPEPIAENLATVCEQMRHAKADVGFCQDPDADRLAVIDETGRYVGEEYTLALCLDHVLRSRQGPVVTNCSTSRMVQDLAERYGVPFFRTPVGEANVVERMQQEGAVFGGEGNGGPIDPRVGWVRDSFVGMALILDALAARDERLSEWVDSLPRYAICKTKVPMERDAVSAAFETLEQSFAGTQPDRQDGLRLDWSDRWLLVRASNTEPIVRVVAEAPTMDQAQSLCRQARELLG